MIITNRIYKDKLTNISNKNNKIFKIVKRLYETDSNILQDICLLEQYIGLHIFRLSMHFHIIIWSDVKVIEKLSKLYYSKNINVLLNYLKSKKLK